MNMRDRLAARIHHGSGPLVDSVVVMFLRLQPQTKAPAYKLADDLLDELTANPGVLVIAAGHEEFGLCAGTDADAAYDDDTPQSIFTAMIKAIREGK